MVSVQIVLALFLAMGGAIMFVSRRNQKLVKKGLRKGISGSDKVLKNQNGPWEECLQLSGKQCVRYIRSQVPQYVQVEVVRGDMDIKGFHPNRVRIQVNEEDSVQQVPARGR